MTLPSLTQDVNERQACSYFRYLHQLARFSRRGYLFGTSPSVGRVISIFRTRRAFMYISLIFILLVGVAMPTASGFFSTPSRNLQRLTSDVRDRTVGVTLCPECIDESVYAINVLLNEILDQGILGDCSKLCGALQNRTGSTVLADVCLLACDGLGIDEFIRALLRVDLDPIWYCEIAKLCPGKCATT